MTQRWVYGPKSMVEPFEGYVWDFRSDSRRFRRGQQIYWTAVGLYEGPARHVRDCTPEELLVLRLEGCIVPYTGK